MNDERTRKLLDAATDLESAAVDAADWLRTMAIYVSRDMKPETVDAMSARARIIKAGHAISHADTVLSEIGLEYRR